MGDAATSSLSHRERVPEGWVRGQMSLSRVFSINLTPHPSAFAPTFSPQEKGNKWERT